MGTIITKHGEKKDLAALFEVSLVTIRRALNDVSKSELAKRIRKAAIERGGAEQPDKGKASPPQCQQK
ncbi:DeoR family transcriptional regulator [Williamwhitmania taraxaci]|uniref:DeoR-like helix-turn-helix domain-containing protein n=1 Tax=Williamwhitmania taraxaci TaxID=1640674 RepID=A0A1G6MF14_9BACT|nr:DeoR family transcriptional regulator [Williamwhitmania taraxaci]SDC53834.1 DeoR-like helix-turn-helix domain-containing protein [Williamwhitmania taraxaci]